VRQIGAHKSDDGIMANDDMLPAGFSRALQVFDLLNSVKAKITISRRFMAGSDQADRTRARPLFSVRFEPVIIGSYCA
jgi:hypothetical protein